MCEVTACLLQGIQEDKIMEAVELVEAADNEVTLTDLFGEKITIKATFKSYSADNNKILFESL